MTDYWFSASHEQFPPSELLEQATAAEQAGFDGIGCSDHFAPWWPEGQSGQAWVWLGAVGHATKLPLGTGVTAPVHRYHPAIVAQAFMSLEEMFPGRVFLGIGSGEALNEVPCGADWPEPSEQIERMEQALDVIHRLWDGETVTADHGWFACREAKLYTRASSRPKVYVSAFGPKAAGLRRATATACGRSATRSRPRRSSTLIARRRTGRAAR
jgi:coenzyme F420-dependent glucose-6-phosphate dehydrogenase